MLLNSIRFKVLIANPEIKSRSLLRLFFLLFQVNMKFVQLLLSNSGG